MRSGSNRAAAFGLALSLIAAAPAAAQSWTLAGNWSDLTNDFGPWTLYKNPTQPFAVNQPDWFSDGTNQKAWADQPFPQNAHVPVWMKVTNATPFSSSPNFAAVGDVVMHTAETGRTGTELSSVVWTAPVGGLATVTGGAWMYKPTGGPDRPQTWELFLNGVLRSTGSMTFGDPYDRTNPFAFAAGTGGSAAAMFAVAPGDEIEVVFRRTSTATPGYFVGTDLGVTVSSTAPEPATLLLVAPGLLVAYGVRRRIKRG